VKVLLVSPVGYPINRDSTYGGIERLVWNYARELSKRHQVTVWGHTLSDFPAGVTNYPYQPLPGEDIFLGAELRRYQQYQHTLRMFDVVHDFSHAHLPARYSNNLPSLNIFWHAPNEVQYPKAPYNIIGLSKWACREFKRYYRHEAKYQQSIALDTSLYCVKPYMKRTKRFLTLGIMAEQKGNLEAILLCRKAGVSLDVAGKGYGDAYEDRVKSLCDGEQVRYLGLVSDEQKVRLMQTCAGLIYAHNRPEVTSHKVQEAMLCGAPVITSGIGAMDEIITPGVNGYLCHDDKTFLRAISDVDRLTPAILIDSLKTTYSIEQVVGEYEPLYEKVANGLRW
jgi:glycosyltransferase involved in cell wall biosynthesis